MMDKAVSEHKIQPLRVSVGGPPISHLLFADDSLFFLKADTSNVEALKTVFQDYEKVLGQRINLR